MLFIPSQRSSSCGNKGGRREREHRTESREREAFKICQKKIREHGLEMKLIDAEYTFDNNKVLFYFTADGRIDFRQLVKKIWQQFFLKRVSNFARLVFAMRQRFWEESVSAEDVCAATHICLSLHLYP